MKNTFRTPIGSLALLLCLLGLATPSFAATFRASQLSRQASDNTCGIGTPVTAFNTRDSEIWAFFFVNNGEIGGTGQVEWIAPNGSVVRTSAFLPESSLKNWCYNFELSSLAHPYQPVTGTWTARFTWKDPSGNVTVTNSTQMTISVTSPPPLTLGVSQMTSANTTGSCDQTPEKTSFLTTDTSARLWFAYPSIPGRTQIKAAFSGPNGLSYSEYSGMARYDGNWCYWKDFDFTGVPAPALPGKWSVRVTADGAEQFVKSFTVSAPGPAVTLSQSSATPTAAAGSFSINVTTSGTWFVVTNVGWITITSPSSGTGNGTVTYAIAANATASQRTGLITIGGQTFTITQAAGASGSDLTITGVLDGAALTSDIAQGSVFIIKGTGLSAPGFVQATAPSYPTTLNDVTVSFIGNFSGALVPISVYMPMIYTYNVNGVNQLAAVMPSTITPGTYQLQVNGRNPSNNGGVFYVKVVARKPGIVTATGDGLGIAQATLQGGLILQRSSAQGKLGIYDTRPAHPGDRMDLWGTGLGADVLSDTGGTSGDQTAAGQIRVVLNGTDIVPGYAGRSQGYPGLDQIVFTIPTNVTLSCTNTIQVRAGGVLSNSVTIATGAGDTCGPTTGGSGPDTGIGGLPTGAKCVSGAVDYILFSLATKASRLADEVSIGGTKLCATCQLKPPLYGNFAEKIEIARTEGLNVDACYDSLGTMNFLRMRQ